MNFIPVNEPLLDGNEKKYLNECIDTGWISSAGKYIPAFEKVFAEYCGVKHGIAVCNGTVALHLALVALDIGKGDEVIIPDFTMIASAFAVCYTAAIPVFVDDDIHADKGWLTAIVETFNRFPDVHLVGGKNLPKYEVEPPGWVLKFKSTTPYGGWVLGQLSLLDIGDQIIEINPNYIWGLNFAIRKQALLDLGGFHPDCIPNHLQHFQGNGETGLTMKANEHGYRAVYQPKALVNHRVPASRLTAEYFEKRAFFQGVCDSYTHIRRARCSVPLPWEPQPESLPARAKRLARRLPSYLRHPLHHGRNFIQRRLTSSSATITAPAEDDELQAVKQRVQKAYRMGYEFHREAIRQEPVLLEWVLREDYWDYRLPQFEMPVGRTVTKG